MLPYSDCKHLSHDQCAARASDSTKDLHDGGGTYGVPVLAQSVDSLIAASKLVYAIQPRPPSPPSPALLG